MNADISVASVAAAIGEPARSRMLLGLLDGRARTSTELAVIADVSPSTASVHLQRLTAQRLVKVLPQGKHRYYSLEGSRVAAALETLSVLAGNGAKRVEPIIPSRLRTARTCYDHFAGTLGVALHDRLTALGWLSAGSSGDAGTFDVTSNGTRAFAGLGIDIDTVRQMRRRFAYACVDWSERKPHLGGALGAAILRLALKRRWVIQDPDGRALDVTSLGRREMLARLGLIIS